METKGGGCSGLQIGVKKNLKQVTGKENKGGWLIL